MYITVYTIRIYLNVCAVYTVAQRVVHEPYEKFMNYAKQPLPIVREDCRRHD